jgi:transposase InsO family protein
MNAIYYDTKHPAGYSGAKNLARYIPASQVKNWLESQEPYTLHAPLRKRFQRNFYKVSKINDTFQADLCDIQKYAKESDNYRYILTVIDVFSKYAWTNPLKDKSAKSIEIAFEEILKNSAADNLMTDSRKEFTNATIKTLYKKYGINIYS